MLLQVSFNVSLVKMGGLIILIETKIES